MVVWYLLELGLFWIKKITGIFFFFLNWFFLKIRFFENVYFFEIFEKFDDDCNDDDDDDDNDDDDDDNYHSIL